MPQLTSATSDKDTLHRGPDDVVRWSKIFADRAGIDSIFSSISAKLVQKARSNAVVIGAAWYAFTANVGELLCAAAARMTDNQKRFTIMQIVWEELGGGNPQEIHADMFLRSVLDIGISEDEIHETQIRWLKNFPVKHLISSIYQAESDHEILGFCAGLEQPANENIETLYTGLAYDEAAAARLTSSYFFRMHRVIEDGHISVGTSNFLRFCSDQRSRSQFLNGFDKAVQFWREFWGCVEDVLARTGSGQVGRFA
jgi:hypothetical protein